MTAERQVWGSRLQFLLTCIGYSVGLGNLWRFPGVAYNNGGGAFLLPYLICSACIGLPCLYLELFIGQFMKTGATNAFRRYKPVFQGLGWTSTVMSAMVGIFYNMIVAICILYLKDAVLGDHNTWVTCENTWNTAGCSNLSSSFNSTHHVLPSDEYFRYKIYRQDKKSQDWLYFGSINWELLTALAGMWLLTCACLIRGIHWIGKISYVTATVPYIIIGCLFVNTCFQPGGFEGMRIFLTPRFDKLGDFQTWSAAANQLCLSLSLGYGGILALSSFNPSNHNCFRDAAIVVFADGFMSIFGGCVVYGTLGYISHVTGVTIEEISKNGQSGLAFAIYPFALNSMFGGRFWAGALFFMFFLLGISSQFGLTQNVVTSITDQFPALVKKTWLVVIGVCLLSFLVGFGLCWQNGIMYQGLLADNTGNTSVFLVILLEILVVIHLYGIHNFMHDLHTALGKGKSKLAILFSHTGYIFSFMWVIVSPAVLLILVLISFHASITKQTDSSWQIRVLQLWVELSPSLLIPIFFVINIVLFARTKSWREAFRIQPQHPAYGRIRPSVKIFPQDEMTKV